MSHIKHISLLSYSSVWWVECVTQWRQEVYSDNWAKSPSVQPFPSLKRWKSIILDVKCICIFTDSVRVYLPSREAHFTVGYSPVVRSMKSPGGSGGTAMPMALLIPHKLLTSQGATWPVISAKFSVTFSAEEAEEGLLRWEKHPRLGVNKGRLMPHSWSYH